MVPPDSRRLMPPCLSLSRLRTLSIIALIFAVLYRPAIGLYKFRSKDRTDSLTRYANSPSINSDRCTVNYAADACEDVKIHYASSTAFLACGNPAERVHWYPPSCEYDAMARSEESFKEDLFKYNLKSRETTRLRLDGLTGDFINHGIDVYSIPGDREKIHIFAVSHGRGGDSIIIFSHNLGSDSVQVVKEVRHPGIKTANGVAAVGPLDFFITNDHYFTAGILRKIEDYFGPWPWATDVQYCDASGDIATCRRVSIRHPAFNGIAISDDRSTLLVGDSQIGVLSIFNITEDKSLVEMHSINLGAAADNIRFLPPSGDAIVSIFPTLEDLPYYKANVRSLGKEVLVPSAALRLRKNNGYAPELIYKSDGVGVSYMTAAAVDPHNRLLIAALVLQYGGFAVCDLSDTALL